MIKHVVMFRFAENAEGNTKTENLSIAKNMLEKLVGVVPTLISAEVSIDKCVSPTNYDLILETTFKTMEGLNDYIVHPAHKAVGEFIKKVYLDRACVDYEF